MVAQRRRWRMVRGGRGAGSARRILVRGRRWRLRVVLPYLVLVVVLALAGGIGWVVYGTTVFVAEHVAVQGAATVPVGDIRAAAAVPVDVPLAQLDTGEIAGRVRVLPPIASVRVTRSWPSSLTISVTERSAVAVLPRNGGVALVDKHGVAFRTVPQRPSHLPEIAVAAPSPDDPATVAAVTVAGQLAPDLRRVLRRISARTEVQVTLELTDGRTVFWGGAEDSARKATVALALLQRPGRRIDVSAPDYVTVR